MPPRDDQEYSSRREQIMEGAFRVFSRKGFEKATNREIANAAGIASPGLIYHYFRDKQDLFQRVIEERTGAFQLLMQDDSLMDLPPRDALALIGSAFMKALDERAFASLIRLILGESLRHPQVAELASAIGPTRGLGFLQRYLTRQMDRGLLRRMDAGAAARAFAGPIVVFFLTREVFPQTDSQSLTSQIMLDTHIEIFLQGMEPRQG